ncbi:odorant receptor 9a-like isoform X2 [Megalopta genalis]|uniref:odorant receptor 9a-like isoform X2 n=1 Tax=Megalopta genalis TaxID=115081 RepID=UPI003FCF7395
MASNDPVEIKDSLLYCERIFATGDVLPQPGNGGGKLFKIVVLYFFHLSILQVWDLCDVLRDFDAVIECALVLPLTLSMLFALVLIRTNKKLLIVIEKIRRDINGAILLADDEEKRLYQKYNNISFHFGKFVSALEFVISYMIYVRPLIDPLINSFADQGNDTRPYVLPFRSHVFFDYRYDLKVYTLLYLYQFPVGLVGMYHAAEVSLIVTATLHVCGKLSMLACRIRMSLTKSPAHFRQRMKTMVMEHLELMELADFLNDCFRHILLIEYLNCSFRFAVTMYVVLMTFGRDTMAAINFILYTIIVAIWLYLYSYIGEQLLHESQKVGEAFYHTVWTDLKNQDKRSLVMCLINGQRPQYLMAGKFYRFTLFGFCDIMKTSMAFLSVLRTRVE